MDQAEREPRLKMRWQRQAELAGGAGGLALFVGGLIVGSSVAEVAGSVIMWPIAIHLTMHNHKIEQDPASNTDWVEK